MYSLLNPGVIGVTAPDLDSAIAAAKFGGFDGVEVNGKEIADSDLGRIKDRLAKAGMKAGAFGLPTDWRASEEELTSSLPDLGRIARACASIGCTRTFTWIMPCSNDREYAENRRFHIGRLTPVARVLEDAGCAFGLEFIGPKTLRDSQRFPFIYQMGPMLEMAREIGPNVGLMLDCWHWYTSGATIADIEMLDAGDVVDVHVNDAPKGVDRDAQIDSIRSVPASTGVIDSQGFMRALQKIGYDGPITPEPFTSELAGLDSDEDRLNVVGEGMRRLFSFVG